MGYTHYWQFKHKAAPKDLENGTERFKEAVATFKRCLDACGGKTKYPNWGADRFTYEVDMKIAGWDGRGNPTITDDLISFNGKGDEAHETCYISLEKNGSEFCKTARKPYDTAVCLALLSFKDAFGDDFEFSSDGGEEEWEYAKSVFEKAA